jgi:hypothetical protein
MPVASWRAMAQGHLEGATVLANHVDPRPHEALYMAGFALELALKGKGLQEGVAVEAIHDLEELLVRSQALRSARATTLPAEKASALRLAPGATYWHLFDFVRSNWINERRYSDTRVPTHVARGFIHAVKELEGWLWTA